MLSHESADRKPKANCHDHNDEYSPWIHLNTSFVSLPHFLVSAGPEIGGQRMSGPGTKYVRSIYVGGTYPSFCLRLAYGYFADG